MRFLLLTLLILFIIGIFYYSWLPNPSLASENYLPLWLRNWSNIYFNLRTAVPFVGLSFLLELWSSITPKKRVYKKWTSRIMNITIAGIIVSIAEIGQFFIAKRHPDSMDLLFGLAGSIIGICLFDFTKFIYKIVSIKNA
jgi:hypothetical protein